MATAEGQTPPDCFNQPNQQSVVFECSVCAENYGPDFEHLSRSLRCGHTFCTKCLMKIMTSRGVKCPMCNLFHTLSSPDVTLLPINYAVQEVLKNISTDDKLVDSQAEPECPPCGVCKLPAAVICVDCMPGNHFHFCSKCDEEEHGRPFGPVQRHRRFPFDKAPGVGSLTTCVRHPGVSVLFYSESLNEFACNMCVAGDYWAANGSQFESVSLVTKKLQGKVQKFSKHTHDILKRLAVSKQNLEDILNNLEPAAINVKADITTRFSALIEALEERQKILLSNVDVELKNRRENVKTQLEVVVNSVTKYRDAFESLNSLISKADLEFLRLYSSVTQNVEPLLESEDKGLIRPVINQTIPFYINKDTEKAVRSLGAVGGGLTPTDLECSSTGSQGSLMELLWQLPEHCGKLSRFQIEYDQLMIERRDSGFLVGSESDPLVYAQSEPQLYEVAGNKLNTFVDYLCPGYSYQFRIRSANDAGWGMWSKPIVGKCEGFPFTLNYTKSIHRVVIPTSGYYRITVKGAKAEDGMVRCGGKGAVISGIFSLKAGDVLILLCGGMSSRHHYHSGGGGGSFVAVNEITQSNLLIAAGGGGGTRGASMEDWDGSDASLTPDGRDGLGEDAGKGGINGGPGTDSKDSASEGPSFGNGGAGFVQNSSTAMSFLSGGHGGQNGGFGGGGAVGMYGGGGGGGYSGGGGGRGGGGGGSYICSAAIEVSKEVGNDTHGSIVIDKVMPPYPLPEQKLTQMVSDESKQADSNSEPSSSVHGLPLYSQSSSGTTGSLLNSLSSRALSTGTSAGIPEGYFESPISTSQVMDQSKVLPAVVSFSVGPDVGSGDNSGHDLCGVRSDAVDLLEADSSGPQVNWRPAGGPALEEFFGSSQSLVTEASSVLIGNSNAATAPAAVRVTEVVTRTPSYSLGTGLAPIGPFKVESKDLIEFHEEGVDSNPDLVRTKVSPEDVATILLQLSTADRVVPSQSQATVSLADNSNGNLDAVRVSKSVLGTTADHNLLSQQSYQEQINPSRPGIPVAVNPVQSTQAVGNPSALSSEQQAVALQWLLQSPQHLDSRELQQKLAELQRYLLAQQQMHQQLLVQPGGKEDSSPPLTQQQSNVPAPVTSQHPPGQLNQSALQPPIYPSNVYQQSQSVHLQQSPLMLVQGGGLTAPTVGTRDQTNQGNVSPPLGARQDQQPQQQQQQQQHQNLASAVAQDSQPSNGVGSDSVQYRQQPLYDFKSAPNWNSNH